MARLFITSFFLMLLSFMSRAEVRTVSGNLFSPTEVLQPVSLSVQGQSLFEMTSAAARLNDYLSPKRRPLSGVRTFGIVSVCLSLPTLLFGGMESISFCDKCQQQGSTIAAVGGGMLAGGLVMIIVGKKKHRQEYPGFGIISNKPNEVGLAYNFR